MSAVIKLVAETARMKPFVLDGSLKNIPMASRHDYKEKLIQQIGKLMRMMGKKAYFLEKGIRREKAEAFGFS